MPQCNQLTPACLTQAAILIFFPYDDRRRHVVTAVTVLRLLRLLRLARFVQVNGPLFDMSHGSCNSHALSCNFTPGTALHAAASDRVWVLSGN